MAFAVALLECQAGIAGPAGETAAHCEDMTQRLKPYVAYSTPRYSGLVPDDGPISPVDVIVVALTKRDVGPLLEDRGVGPGLSAILAEDARLASRCSVVGLIEAGLIARDRSGVYLRVCAGRPDERLLERNLDGSTTVIAVRENGTYRTVSDTDQE